MLLRFVRASISRAPRRKALIVAAIAMGSAVATAMLGVMFDIGDKVNRELQARNTIARFADDLKASDTHEQRPQTLSRDHLTAGDDQPNRFRRVADKLNAGNYNFNFVNRSVAHGF